MAQHTEVQKKVHQEIDQILEKYGTNINYDIIMNEMSYLEMVFNGKQIKMYILTGCCKSYEEV